jgi:hypothetical protein
VSSEHDNRDAVFPNCRREPGEISVSGDQTESINPTGVKLRHRIDYQCNVGGIFPWSVGHDLYRDDSMFTEDIYFAYQSPSVGASIGNIPILLQLQQSRADAAHVDVVCVDEDGNLW